MARFGVTIFPTDYSIQPVELAVAAEERGFDSLLVTEHTHDPLVALSAAAAVTKRIRLGTGICLVVERDPIQLAKEVASLDTISNGRFVFGIGAGWNREEMENHGVAYPTRWKLVREKVLAMRAIWTQDQPEFHGEFVDFDPLWSWPKPVQAGGPPVWLGAQSKWAFDRVVDYCDGWMPIGLMGGLEEGMAALRQAAARAGRPFEEIDKTIFAAQPTAEACEQNIALGFTELCFALPSKTSDEVLPLLDQFAELANQLR